MTDTSPLATTDPDFLKHIFAPTTDPLTLSDDDLTTMVTEVRRRRSSFLAAEAAAQSKGKRGRNTTSAAAAAALDKPVGEVSLDDLEGWGMTLLEDLTETRPARATGEWKWPDATRALVPREPTADDPSVWRAVPAHSPTPGRTAADPLERLSHDDACCLSRHFNRAGDLREDQHRRINEWLKAVISRSEGVEL